MVVVRILDGCEGFLEGSREKIQTDSEGVWSLLFLMVFQMVFSGGLFTKFFKFFTKFLERFFFFFKNIYKKFKKTGFIKKFLVWETEEVVRGGGEELCVGIVEGGVGKRRWVLCGDKGGVVWGKRGEVFGEKGGGGVVWGKGGGLCGEKVVLCGKGREKGEVCVVCVCGQGEQCVVWARGRVCCVGKGAVCCVWRIGRMCCVGENWEEGGCVGENWGEGGCVGENWGEGGCVGKEGRGGLCGERRERECIVWG